MSNWDSKVISFAISDLICIANDLAKNNPIPQYRGIQDALLKMLKEEGFYSLYRGVLINMVAGSIANSIFFYAYTDGKKRYNYDS